MGEDKADFDVQLDFSPHGHDGEERRIQMRQFLGRFGDYSIIARQGGGIARVIGDDVAEEKGEEVKEETGGSLR